MSQSYKSFDQLKRAWTILSELKAWGAFQFCLCPGARNAPFVFLLSHSFFSKDVFYCFEERSAGFFAIGRIKKDLLPVVVVTTSGTAVGELLPSAMEAFYSGLPLVFLTADRPRSYRHSGAPQSVEQKGIFLNYVRYEFDLDESSSFSLDGISPLRGPIHINVSFDEPLGDFSFQQLEKIFKKDFFHFSKENQERIQIRSQKQSQSYKKDQIQNQGEVQSRKLIQKKKDFHQESLTHKESLTRIQDLKDFLKDKKPFILIGELPLDFRASISDFLKALSYPLYAEPLSGLRESKALSHLLLSSWEKVFHLEEFKRSFDSVIRIGGVPTLRFWRDLEKKKSFPVFNVSHLPFKGLSFISSSPLPLEDFCLAIEKGLLSSKDFLAFPLESSYSKSFQGFPAGSFRSLKFLFEKDKEIREKIEILLKKFPFSEPGMLSKISLSVKEGSSIFLGNSLPLREWDLAASCKRAFDCHGQRGTNGIDGLVSHFLGRACLRGKKETRGEKKEERSVKEKRGFEHWCIVGDLSALYDLNALWMLKEFSFSSHNSISSHHPIRIVVVNNYGGRIFSRVFKNSFSFENQHSFNFYHWAKMFGCAYRNWSKTSKDSFCVDSLPLEPLVIELNPSKRETELFWKEFETF